MGIGVVGAPGDDASDWAETAAQVRAGGMRATMEEIAAEEPEPPPGWLLDNLAGTQAEMFALMLEAWASEPAGWADFPHVQVPALVICGENEEPSAARNAQLAATAMPHGTAVVLPGLWHLQAFWRTDQTLPPLTSFLRQHTGSSQQTAPGPPSQPASLTPHARHTRSAAIECEALSGISGDTMTVWQ